MTTPINDVTSLHVKDLHILRFGQQEKLNAVVLTDHCYSLQYLPTSVSEDMLRDQLQGNIMIIIFITN